MTIGKSFCIKDIAGIKQSEWPATIRKINNNSDDVQEAVLMDILNFAGDTEYGRKYGFAGIKSSEEYRKTVPITDFDSYQEYSERLRKGEENILFPGKAFYFVITSGTTGKIKHIPESAESDLVKTVVGGMRTREILRIYPEGMKAEKKLLAITNGYSMDKTEAGISVGSASGQAAAQTQKGTAEKMVIPQSVLKTWIEPEALDYIMSIFAAAEPDLSAVVCNNPIHFKNLLGVINDSWEMIYEDLRNGTISIDMDEESRKDIMPDWRPHPERAEYLNDIYEEKGSLSIEDMWPDFGFVGCWLSSGVGRYAKELKDMFPKDTIFMHWGYGASEGKFDIPIEPNAPDGLPALFGYYFEFLEEGAEDTVTFGETVDGRIYELIITSYGGFYRYNIHDLVKVHVKEDGFKTIEFVCKSSDHIIIEGKKFYAWEYTDIIEAYEKEHNMQFRIFRGRVTDAGFEVLVEPAGRIDEALFSRYITKAFKQRGIEVANVKIMEDGYRDNCLVEKLSNGKTVNQTKLQVFI